MSPFPQTSRSSSSPSPSGVSFASMFMLSRVDRSLAKFGAGLYTASAWGDSRRCVRRKRVSIRRFGVTRGSSTAAKCCHREDHLYVESTRGHVSPFSLVDTIHSLFSHSYLCIYSYIYTARNTRKNLTWLFHRLLFIIIWERKQSVEHHELFQRRRSARGQIHSF